MDKGGLRNGGYGYRSFAKNTHPILLLLPLSFLLICHNKYGYDPVFIIEGRKAK